MIKFSVIVPSYNNKDYVERNLCSILDQDYSNYEIFYINDGSVDGTEEYVKSFRSNKLHLLSNTRRVGAMENIYNVVSFLPPTDVVVMVDGDDWLPHKKVFDTLRKVYTEKNIWLSVGNYKEYPTCRVKRQIGWFDFYHLKTFYAALFQKIAVEDLKYEGEFVLFGHDVAMMYPMVEMAGKHIYRFKEVLYIYNIENPLGDGVLHGDKQWEIGKYVLKKQKYPPLENFFD